MKPRTNDGRLAARAGERWPPLLNPPLKLVGGVAGIRRPGQVLHDAHWNAHVFQRLADGVARPAAWRAGCRSGPRPGSGHDSLRPRGGRRVDEFGHLT